MIGLGTIVNCGTVLAGASIGMLLKNGLSKRFEETIMQGIGLCTMFIGIGGAVSTLLTIEDGQILHPAHHAAHSVPCARRTHR